MPQSPPTQTLFLYSTTVSDTGTVRSNNQDSSFAGEHLVSVCDGMGGHAGGDTASTIAIRSLAHIERDDTPEDVAEVARMMDISVLAAHDAIAGKAKHERRLSGMGTTLTAVALVNGHWILAHIGDSRAYLLRGGRLMQVSADHSYVQHLIDTGHISEAEARNHPQRNVVMRVLGDFDIDPHPDIAIRKAEPSDRWLLCSDGLSGVLEEETIAEALTTLCDQEECAQQLVSMALRAGSTDNVTAVVAEATLALDENAFDLPHQTPLVGGAAATSLDCLADVVGKPVASAPALRTGRQSPAWRAAALAQDAQDISHAPDEQDTPRVAQPSSEYGETDAPPTVDTGEIPVVRTEDGDYSNNPHDPQVVRAIERERRERHRTASSRRRRGRLAAIIVAMIALIAMAASGFVAYRWSQGRYYLGRHDGKVTIYQGVPVDIFGWKLSHEVEHTDTSTDSLPQDWLTQLDDGIAVDSLQEARDHADLIADEARKLRQEHKRSPAEKSQSEPSDTAPSSVRRSEAQDRHADDAANPAGSDETTARQGGDGS